MPRTALNIEVDKDLLEISGSTKQYKIDMDNFLKKFEREVKKLKTTPAGRKKLKRAGLTK